MPNLFSKPNSNLHYVSLENFSRLVVITLTFLFLLKFEPEKEGEVCERQKDG